MIQKCYINVCIETMNWILALICLAVLPSAVVCEGKIYGYVSWERGKAVAHVGTQDIPSIHVARATYSNEINKTGWAYLELHTNADCSDEKQAYAAGYLEGFLTRDLIWMHWQNMLKGYCYNKTELCGLIEDFLDINEDYIATMIRENPRDPYWYQMKLYYIQVEGLAVGYNHATTDAYQWLTVRDIIWINMLGDLDDVATAVADPPALPDDLMFGAHCSGLVKLLPDLSELYTAHATWNSYQSMLRLQKLYALSYRESPASSELIAGHKMSFTSYPGFVQSTDDFYVVSSGLVAAETTLGNTNRALYRRVRPTGQVMEYARAMVATRLARGGREWTDIFRRHNSGTYNNQWYVVDYKRFERGAARAGLLWVLEQLPGYTEAADLTEDLKRTSYFPSYNIARSPRVFNLSGGAERVAALGDWFGYDTNPRALIFKDLQAGLSNVRDVFLAMRYNDFKHDPRARCAACAPPYSACNAIAARNDLNPANGTYPFRALGHRSHGATDAKVTSAALRRTYQFLAVSGPPHNVSRGIPPFAWSEFDMGATISHVGHPDLWVFPPVLHAWEWE